MPYLDYNQSNGYLLLSYLEELIPGDHVARVVNRVGDFGKNNIKGLKIPCMVKIGQGKNYPGK
jgi:hypothetical protein